LQSTNELRKKIIEEIIVFFEQKNNTKKINPIFKQKLGMTLKQEITTWITKSEFGPEHPIS
jgi:hypothetical protein